MDGRHDEINPKKHARTHTRTSKPGDGRPRWRRALSVAVAAVALLAPLAMTTSASTSTESTTNVTDLSKYRPSNCYHAMCMYLNASATGEVGHWDGDNPVLTGWHVGQHPGETWSGSVESVANNTDAASCLYIFTGTYDNGYRYPIHAGDWVGLWWQVTWHEGFSVYYHDVDSNNFDPGDPNCTQQP